MSSLPSSCNVCRILLKRVGEYWGRVLIHLIITMQTGLLHTKQYRCIHPLAAERAALIFHHRHSRQHSRMSACDSSSLGIQYSLYNSLFLTKLSLQFRLSLKDSPSSIHMQWCPPTALPQVTSPPSVIHCRSIQRAADISRAPSPAGRTRGIPTGSPPAPFR